MNFTNRQPTHAVTHEWTCGGHCSGNNRGSEWNWPAIEGHYRIGIKSNANAGKCGPTTIAQISNCNGQPAWLTHFKKCWQIGSVQITHCHEQDSCIGYCRPTPPRVLIANWKWKKKMTKPEPNKQTKSVRQLITVRSKGKPNNIAWK